VTTAFAGAATLSVNGARIAIGPGEAGVLARDLTFESHARRIALIGDVTPLVRALVGVAHVSAGELRVVGLKPARAIQSGRLGVALADGTLPARWRAAEVLEAAARLRGAKSHEARVHVRAFLARWQLEALGQTRVHQLTDVQRRLLLIAQAALVSPEVVLLEAPLLGLEIEEQLAVQAFITGVAAGGKLILTNRSTTPLDVERTLLLGMDELVSIGGSHVLQGRPEQVLRPGPQYLVTVTRNADALLQHFEQTQSALATPLERFQRVGADFGASGGSARLLVEPQGEGGAGAIIAAAVAVGAAVIELIPLAAAAPPR
jgi:ABC-type Na+ transport system ATPase subunit NatA